MRLELEGFLLAGDPHARGIIWDLAVDEQKGELYVLSDTRPMRGVAEVRVFDRRGEYLRTIMPLNPTLPRSSVQDLCRKTAREGGAELVIPKLFEPWGEVSMYGDWWHHPQKMTLAPNGDLIMDCQGIGSEFPHPELPFGTISGLSVWKDRLFVVDELNRRIVKCRIIYGKPVKKAPRS